MTAYVNNWAGVEDDAVLTVADNPSAATDAAQGGFTMDENYALYCSASDPGAYDTFNDGIAVSPLGAMRVLMCATAEGPPEGVCWTGGLPVTATGQLCLTADGTVDHWVAGWPVDIGGLIVTSAAIEVTERVTADGDTRVTADGDTRIIA